MIASFFFPQFFNLFSVILQGRVQAESSLSAYALNKPSVKNPKHNNKKPPLVRKLYSHVSKELHLI